MFVEDPEWIVSSDCLSGSLLFFFLAPFWISTNAHSNVSSFLIFINIRITLQYLDRIRFPHRVCSKTLAFL